MTDNLDNIRSSVLDRMERSRNVMRYALLGAAIAEAGLFAVAFMLLDFSIRLEKILFIFFVLTYTILALGMVALGAHVSRTAGRILAAMESR